MKNAAKYKKVLLRDKSAALELAVQKKISDNPKFMHNFYNTGVPANEPINISANWHNLDYLIVTDKANIEDIKTNDILLYVSFSIDRPNTDVSQVSLISFCNDIEFVCKVAGEMCDHLWENFKTNIIHFSAKEGATTYKLFYKINNDGKLANKLFPNWYGRYIGYKTHAFTSQDRNRHHLHFFEIIRKEYAESSKITPNQ